MLAASRPAPRPLALALALALACCAAMLAAAVAESGLHDNSSLLLVNSLRRQLMKDSYDYMTSDEDSSRSTVGSEENRRRNTAEEQKVTKVVAESALTAEEEDKKLATNNKDQKNEGKPKKESEPSEQTNNQSKSDLKSVHESKHLVRRNHSRKFGKRRTKRCRYLYDIDEDIAKVYQRRYSRRLSYEDSSVTDRHSYNTELTTAVTYKVLKLRNQYRRSGLPAALIQEESPDGVSLVKLGDGPFPELRLSGARRQYMRAPAPLRPDEEEVPPPPVNTTV